MKNSLKIKYILRVYFRIPIDFIFITGICGIKLGKIEFEKNVHNISLIHFYIYM